MDKIITYTQVEAIASHNEILLISGSFDVLHLGHLKFFKKAKSRTTPETKLLVVVLGDEEIKSRKGDKRPIFNLSERVTALTFIEIVDYILPWTRPWKELRKFVLEFKPKYLAVVEGDPGYENKSETILNSGGKLIVVKKTDNFSSSSIIEKLGL